LRQSFIEEAIASSQLEGAATTRERAKRMFAENLKPMSNGEWMIYNNYQTIKKIEEESSKYPLSKEMLLELHITMTSRTDLDDEKIGRWRKDSDDIVVRRQVGNEYLVAHVPPVESKIEAELDKLIAFANDIDTSGQDDFIHPILKAIMIHFWFAYIHPFCDGNGRLSRSLFYWYLLRQKYWLISYVPISTVIKKSPSQYADAYSFSEQYNNDLTYFIDYNLRKIQQALTMFEQHVERVKEKSQEIDRLLPDKDLNSRQKQVLHHLLGKPEDGTSVTQHAQFHEISWLTASQDIKALKMKGYIVPQRIGTSVIYHATDKLKQFIE
jgi:Fic family protein